MRKYSVAVLLLAVFFTLSCSNITRWNQDPFGGMDKPVKDGEEKPTDPTGPKPIPSDALRIRAPEYVSFKELRADKFVIEGQVLLKDYTGTLEIENLRDFPEATFDETSGEFSWTPAKGATGSDLSSERTLKVKLYAQKLDEPTLVTEKNIKIGIARTFVVPEVVSVSKQSEAVREDTRMTVTVMIRDNDAVVADKTTWPKLQITNFEDMKSLANFVYVHDVDVDSAGLYKFSLYVDLYDVEITPSVEMRAFAVKALSRFNLSSAEQAVTVEVFTNLSDAVSTWTERLEVTAGDVLEQQFLIADPKGEGHLTLANFSSLPSGAEAKCVPVSTATVLACSLKWATQVSDVGNYVTKANLEIRNANSSDSRVKYQNLQLKFRVNPPPPTTTTLPVTTTTQAARK